VGPVPGASVGIAHRIRLLRKRAVDRSPIVTAPAV